MSSAPILAAPVINSTWTFNDGGRAAAGFKGRTGDCVTRAISIATGLPYQHVYDLLTTEIKGSKLKRHRKGTARDGVRKVVIHRVMESLGWTWVPTMFVGQGCKVHLKANELPAGRIVASCSKHTVALIDGVINDTYDPSREGTRCVYGYFIKQAVQQAPVAEPILRSVA